MNRAFVWLNKCKNEGYRWDPWNLNKMPKNVVRYLLPNIKPKNRWDNVKAELAERYNDVSTFRKKLKGIFQDLFPGKKIIADKGYKGERDLVSMRNPFDPDELTEFKDRVLARHESRSMRMQAPDGVINAHIKIETLFYNCNSVL